MVWRGRGKRRGEERGVTAVVGKRSRGEGRGEENKGEERERKGVGSNWRGKGRE